MEVKPKCTKARSRRIGYLYIRVGKKSIDGYSGEKVRMTSVERLSIAVLSADLRAREGVGSVEALGKLLQSVESVKERHEICFQRRLWESLG